MMKSKELITLVSKTAVNPNPVLALALVRRKLEASAGLGFY
jgi:hypothetical protein